MRIYQILGAGLILALATPAVAAAPDPDIVGAWVNKGSLCASGDPYHLDRGGVYRQDVDTEGRWFLVKSTLVLSYWTMDYDTQKRTSPVTRLRLAYRRLDANRITLNGLESRRCPPKGGREPWFPKQTFTTD